MKLNDKVYNVLKWLALIFFDAIGVFYKTIAMIWHLPYGDEVLNTCAAISVLIGSLIGISTVAYLRDKKGE